MNRKFRLVSLLLVTVACADVCAATDWSTQEFDLYPGDFNGDGRTDLLYIAKDPSDVSGLALSDGSAPNTPWQTWPGNYLGIPWSGNGYAVHVADFNNDGKADIFLQRNTPGDHFLLLTNAQGKVTAISQTLANSSLGVVWSADQHRIVSGDFNQDGRADLFLQATSASGLNAVMLASASGQFASGPAQSWNEGFLGFRWNTREAIVVAGDFNGDQRADLLIQAKPKIALIDFDIPIPVPTYPPNLNGVLYSQPGGALFQLSALQAWGRNAFGVDWSPLTADILVGNFNGTGGSDVVLQSRNGSKPTYLLSGNPSGAAFASGVALDSNVTWAANSFRLIAGNFDGGSVVGVYFQAVSPSGTNYYANTVTGSVSVSAHTSAAPTGILPATAVGHTSGSFAVSNTGAATYAVPIVVPPGIAGLQPKLGLAYQSGGSNGLLGVGWDISGLSEIERCRKTLSQDNASGGVTLTNSDVFCLDGSRLRLLSGSYGAAGSTYRTELEAFARITANSSAGNGPASFTVEARDGLIFEYGNSTDSRIESTAPGFTTTARAWALNKVSDRHGNTMTITYQEDGAGGNGGFRPLTISYTSNSSASIAAAYQVDFIWEPRPSNDILTEYVAGGLVRENLRLDRIDTRHNHPTNGWQVVRQYHVSYNNSGSAPRSRLAAIQECDGAGNCVSATSISWQSGVEGLEADTASGVSGSGAIYAIPTDVNGDGRMDLFYPVFNASGVGTWWYALGNSSGTYGAPVSTGIQGSNVVAQFASVMPIDYNADGLGDILVPSNSGQWQILRSTGSGFTVVSTSFSAPTTANRAWVTDVNGDGRQDLVYLAGAINQNNTLTILLNTASGFVSGGTSTPLGTNAYFNAIASLAGGGQSRSAAEVADFNSDGLWDLLVSYSVLTGSAQSGFSTEQRIAVLASTGSGYALSGSPLVTLVQNTAGINGIFDTLRLTDFNADGVVDVLYQCPSTGTWCVRFGTGLGLGAQISTGFSAGTDKAKTVITDWNGDGSADALEVGSNGNWHVMRSTGEVAAPLLAPVDTGVPTGSPQGSAATDVNGDGLLDLQYLDASNSWRYRLHKAPFPDLVSAVTDGFGNTVSLQYGPLTDSSVYTKGSAASYPDMSVQIPLYVVKQYSTSDGIGGTYAVTHSYSDARINLHGRGYLGFASRTEVDARTGIQSNWTYRQDFPFVGQASVVTVKQPGGSLTISQITNTYLTSTFGTGFNQRWFPFLYQSLERTYEVGGTANGQQISEVTATNGFDTYGNHTSSVVVTRDPVSGQQFETHKSATFLNDEPSWCVSLVTRQDETRYLPNLANQHRVTSFTPDPNYSRCRVQRKTVEPFTPAWTVTTDYGYDAAGNITSETVAATGIANRVTTRDFGTRKVLPVTMTNAAGETTTATYDFALGATLTATDPNGITTSFQYDGFGRKTRESRPDGVASTWTRYACSTANGFCGDSLLRYQIIEQQLDSGATLIRHATERFDSMGRPKYQELQTLSGASAVVRVHYDNQGRVQQRSQPHFAGFNPYYTTFGYDLIGRPILEQRQVSETDTSLQSLQTTYARFTHSMIDANSKTITKLMNAIGQTVQMTDAASGVTQYEYDPFGNLTKTIDPAGNQSTAFFNIRGFKTSASDPDMGNWSFDFFPTGELKSQTDAIPRTVTFTYDGVSRPLTRTELEGTTQWTYGTSVANKNVGKLVSVTAPGSYSEVYTYDSLGRSSTVTTNAESTAFVISNTYNVANGLLDTVTYPTSTSAVPGSRFKVQYEYAFGLLQRVKDFNSPSVIYWEQMATDAAGRSIDERFGNALHTYTTYDGANGFLGTRVTGASAQVQNLTYSWDKMGNLTERKDVALSLTERFFYDNLYRLDYSTLNNVTNLDLAYDSIGNITSKSDVGTYTYHATKKHAVVSAGSQSFGYDANGNMTSRKGSAITWSSYNLPLQMNEGSNSAQFSYGPGRARYKQVAVTAAGGPLPAGTETTIYIGGFFEKVTKPSAVVEYKHYVMAGEEAVALRTLRSNSVNDTRYLHKDHLGSFDAITDETGAVVLKLSFDAFGKRRSPGSWSGAPSSGNWTTIAATTHRGFTFHEGLDNVGLVHMNGRAYDPTIGRFISADPHVQDATNSQMLNRYSYVTNNPLSYTDPSGFFLKKLFKKIGSFLKKYWRPILAIVAAVVVGVWVYNAYMAAASKAALAAANAAISAAADASIAASIYTSSMATAGMHAAVLSGAAAGFVGGAIATGSLKGALVGALSGAAFGVVSGYYGNTWNVQRVLADGVAGGFSAEIGGGKFGEGFAMALGFSAANWAARTMREKMWDSSLKNPENSSGTSMGFEGDGRRLGGCRAPCDWSPLGGVQGKDPAYLIRDSWAYSPGSLADGLVEAYSGPHDWFNSHFFYDAMGNNRNINGWVTQKLGTVLNAANVVVATPFVLASTSPGSFYGYLAGK